MPRVWLGIRGHARAVSWTDLAGWVMTRASLFPVALIVLDVGAGIVYVFDGDVRRCVYWLAAAILTAAVTF